MVKMCLFQINIFVIGQNKNIIKIKEIIKYNFFVYLAFYIFFILTN